MVSQLAISGFKCFARRCPKAVAAAEKLLCQKPQGIGLRYARAIEEDVTQFSCRNTEQISKKAEKLFIDVRKEYNPESIEKYYPEMVKNVAMGNIRYGGEISYSHYKILEKFYNENPEMFVLLGEMAEGADGLALMLDKYFDVPIKIVEKMPKSKLEQVFRKVDNYAQQNGFEPDFCHYMNMLIMSHHNPKTYEFLMKTKDINISSMVEKWGDCRFIPSTCFLKDITPEQIQVMSNDCLPYVRHLHEYVACSDRFLGQSKEIQELSADLSMYRLSTNVALHRGDKSVGMFDSISIGKELEASVRQLLEKNKDYAKSVKITGYTGRYSSEPNTNLYDFLSSKETLTLADAMQIAKYGDEKYINELIQRIKTSKITDTRFKSYSFDEGMARGWSGTQGSNNTRLIQHANVMKGTEGGYIHSQNAQYEVILNNTPKEISIQDVAYNKKSDAFEIDTIVQNI